MATKKCGTCTWVARGKSQMEVNRLVAIHTRHRHSAKAIRGTRRRRP